MLMPICGFIVATLKWSLDGVGNGDRSFWEETCSVSSFIPFFAHIIRLGFKEKLFSKIIQPLNYSVLDRSSGA